MTIGSFTNIQDLFSVLPTGRRNCENNSANPIFFCHFRNIISVSHNWNTFQKLPFLIGIIINRTAYSASHFGRIVQFLDQNLTGRTCSHDHHPLFFPLFRMLHFLPPVDPGTQKPVGETNSHRKTEAQQIPHKIIRKGHRKMSQKAHHQINWDQYQISFQDLPKFCQADQSPDTVIQLENIKNCHGDQNHPGHRSQIPLQIFYRYF